MNRIAVTVIALAGAAAGGLWWVTRPAPPPTGGAALPPGAPLVEITLPAALSPQAQIGKRGFDDICAACHGENATGRAGMGPPLVHRIYEPGHHAEEAFQRAVALGVPAHHWPFGDMPPQPGLTRTDVAAITAYVRELQRANGID